MYHSYLVASLQRSIMMALPEMDMDERTQIHSDLHRYYGWINHFPIIYYILYKNIIIYSLIRARILKHVYNIVSQQDAISPRRVLSIFPCLFIEGIWGWKLDSRKFYYNFYCKNHPKWEKHEICFLSWAHVWCRGYRISDFVNLFC